MPTLDEVYCKFGLTAEAAQLLETELGTLLKAHRLVDAGLFESFDLMRAGTIFQSVNRHTLGQLLKSLNNRTQSLDTLTDLLAAALKARNRLSHSFYREHNLLRNSEEGSLGRFALFRNAAPSVPAYVPRSSSAVLRSLLCLVNHQSGKFAPFWVMSGLPTTRPELNHGAISASFHAL